MSEPRERPALDKALARLTAAGAVNLTEQARAGLLGRAYGRQREVEAVLVALSKRRNVLLLGLPGVGKTAILHEVTSHLAARQAPAILGDAHIFQIATGAIESGAFNTGQWSKKLHEVVDALIAGKQIFLYVDNIWHLRDAGRYTGEIESFATFLRPYLERKDIVLLGESTPEYYRHSSAHGLEGGLALADDSSLMRLFEVITVEEPDLAAARAILSSVAVDLEGALEVQIPPNAVERSIELTRRFMPYRFLPGKAIQLLGQAAGLPRPGRETGSGGEAGSVPAREAVITADMVTTAFAGLTGVPEKIFSDAIPLQQDEVRKYFAERVVGQQMAVNTIVDLLTILKAELNDPGRPLGVLLFIGPTGTGKTLMATTLAEYIFGSAQRLIRFDMSEYQNPELVPRLAYHLVDRLRQESFAVLLLDEIEKASSGAFDLFLQAFDDARLTDLTGRSADLRNTIIILTSNLAAGAPSPEKSRSLGFLGVDHPAPRLQELLVRAVEWHFRPEFVNRLDKIVAFQPLDVEDMRRIARRELGKALLREGTTRRNILLDFREEVLDVLVTTGFSPRYGARPLQRAIRELVLLPLARRIAARPSLGNQLLELHAEGGSIDIARIPVRLSEPEAAPPAPASGNAGGPIWGMPSLDRLAEAIAELRERLAGHAGSPRFGALEARSRALLDEMAKPSFWDDQDRSRGVLAAIHHLERITDAIVELHGRADALAEIPGLIRRHPRVEDVARLGAKYEALRSDVALAELEYLSCDADTVATGGAFICISPVTSGRARDPEDWPAVLCAMYMGWARGKGYEVEAIHEDGSTDLVLVVRGLSTAAILRGESGIHKRQSPTASSSDPQRPEIHLARVEVLPLPGVSKDRLPFAPDEVTISEVGQNTSGEGRGRTRRLVEVCHKASNLKIRVQTVEAEGLASALLIARLGAHGTTAGQEDTPVRVYNLVRNQYVRDPRTGERASRLKDVLGGRIDPFLLAFLKQRDANPSGEPTGAHRS